MTLDRVTEFGSMMEFIWDEIDRIHNAEPAQGEQSIAVQKDMKQWAEAEGWWPASHYQDIVLGHAEARGWTQQGFTGLEMPHATDS